jgi:hypothetical protein
MWLVMIEPTLTSEDQFQHLNKAAINTMKVHINRLKYREAFPKDAFHATFQSMKTRYLPYFSLQNEYKSTAMTKMIGPNSL